MTKLPLIDQPGLEPPIYPTAAEALIAIDSWTDLTSTRRPELAVAVRLLGRITGRPLEAIRMEPSVIAPAVFDTATARIGIRAASLYTYRCSLRAVLRRLGIIASRARGQDLADDWSSLLALAGDRHATMALTRFARFCGARKIAPADVRDATVEAFINDLTQSQLMRSPRQHAAALVRTWNKCAETRPGWPSTRLTLPPTDMKYTLAWTAFPEDLRYEVAAFQARLEARSAGTLFSAIDGPPRPLRRATIARRMHDLKFAVGALVQAGTPPEAITGLDVVMRPENLCALLEWLYARGGNKVGAHLGSISATLLVVGRHHLRFSGALLKEVEEILRNAKPPKQREITPKNAARLREAEVPRIRAALVHLPRELMRRAAALKSAGQAKRAAWLASVATAIEILLARPLRLENLAHLQLARHLVRAPQARAAFTDIIITEGETKNGVRIDWPIGSDVAAVIDDYVRDFRPLIATGTSTWLFPSRDHSDRPRSPGGLSKAISGTIYEAIGIRMHVHLFRAFAGALALEDNPNAIEEVRQLLGHRTMATALQYYTSLNARRAARRLDERLTRQRKITRLAAAAFFRGRR